MPPARAASRRNTPQAQPAVSGSLRRSTRSQSREVSVEATNITTEQPTGRRARISRQASVESTNSVDSRGGRATRAGRRNAPAITELPPVEESPANVRIREERPSEQNEDDKGHEEEIDETPARDTEEDDAVQSRRLHSPRRISNISGTTAYSTDAVADVDAEDIVNEITDLYHKTQQLLDIIIPEEAEDAAEIIKQLRVPAASKILAKKERGFDTVKKTFGSGTFIRCSTILRSLFPAAESLKAAPWRPDNILYKANLAEFVRKVITTNPDKKLDIFNMLQEFDQTFPQPFLLSFKGTADTTGASSLLEQTYKVALELHTQLAIFLILVGREQPEFDAYRVIAEVFLTPESLDTQTEAYDQLLSRGDLRQWSVPGGEDPDETFMTITFKRIDKLRGLFKDAEENEEPADLDQLQLKFPYENFISLALAWARQRDAEIEGLIGSDKGVRKISRLLEREIGDKAQRPSDPAAKNTLTVPKSPSKRRDVNPPQTADIVGDDTTLHDADINDLNVLKELDRRVSGKFKANPPRSTEVITEAQEEDDWRPAPQEQEDDQDNAPPKAATDPFPSSAKIRGIMREHEKQNKENHRRTHGAPDAAAKRQFIDRQAGATKVQWDESQANSSAQRNATPGPSNTAKGKRPREESVDNEDPSEDEGFETDTREHAQREARPSPKKRRRFGEIDSPKPVHQLQKTSRPAVVKTVRQPRRREPTEGVSEEEQSPERSQSWATQHARIATQAKVRVMINSQARRTQTRNPWTTEEIDALIDYIGELGCSWAAILRRDASEAGTLQNRTQVQLKDKAVNLKYDYLKVKQSMPPGFKEVPVRSRDKQYLLDNEIFDSEVEIKDWE